MSGAPKLPAYASAVARHISSDGCQLVVQRDLFMQGERYSFTLDGFPMIQGTVRWVVKDRVGFAFDAPISSATQTAIQQRCRLLNGLDLFLT